MNVFITAYSYTVGGPYYIVFCKVTVFGEVFKIDLNLQLGVEG